MKTHAKIFRNKHRGIALLLSMVFIVIFSAISIGFLSLSSANTQLADNHRVGNNALNAAFSGLELMRYWCSRSDIAIPGLTPLNQRYEAFIIDVQGVLNDSGIPFSYDADTGTLTIGSADDPINIDTATDSCFYAQVTPGSTGMNILICGRSRQVTRRIGVQFTYGVRPRSVFDFGVATKGPLVLDGGTLTGATVKSEADVYIESLYDDKALGVLNNKSVIAGVAKIVNPNANITIQDIKGTVGGLSGQNAIDQTIDIGVAPTEFPYPDAAHFKQYATGGYYAGGTTLENVIIPAGAGTASAPYVLEGGSTVTGILYIEAPNVIDFGGNVTVKGMIIAEGDSNDNSGTNKLTFSGSIDSYTLPADAKFDAMRQETGTFLMAPGFDLSFMGSFGTLNGVIAGNGINFTGNAGGTVNGSVINYSTQKMNVTGSGDILFNRSGITEIPAGFVQDIVIHYNPESYLENI